MLEQLASLNLLKDWKPTMRELIFVDFADSDWKNKEIIWGNDLKMTWSTKFNFGKIFISFTEKKILK